MWLLPCLIANVILAADSVAATPVGAGHDTQPIPAERLRVRVKNSGSILFADLTGPNGRAVCFAFLHPACPLA